MLKRFYLLLISVILVWITLCRKVYSDGTSSRSNDDYVVTKHGVPHRHTGQPVTDIDQNDVGIHIPEAQRIQEIQELIDELSRQNPDMPPVDAESLTDKTDAEIKEMLKEFLTNHKRFVEGDESERWTGGYVPFIYTSSITPDDQRSIKAAMRRIEKYTCIRFVPWVEGVTREQYGLDHEGHLNFVDGDGCYAVQGNNRKVSGQSISCCGKSTCLHELGHSLGVFHEHQHPHSPWWIRINWENINPDYWSQYKLVDADGVRMYNYDITSIMHYGRTTFNANGGKTQTLLFPELSIKDNTYYQFFEIVDSHDCEGLRCPTFSTTCENEGYVTFLDNEECTCMCPYGLNRTDGCASTITYEPALDIWPGGNFALLASEDGCPGSNVFTEGEITHWSRGGSYESSNFHLKGEFLSESTNLHFCVLDSNINSVKWPPGSYCVHRVGEQCPEGFDEGHIQFDDVIRSETENNTNSGTLPDGVFDIDTLLYFCCRDDGYDDEPLELPNENPFVLYRYKDDCHPVKGMFSIEEFYYFYNYNSDDTIAGSSGAHPKLYKSSSKKYKSYFCYYTPYTMDCGGVIELDSANPSAVITSPNYPDPYDTATECNWLIKAPENSTILLNFADLQIEESGGVCQDTLEIRPSHIGQPGIKYCGDGMDESIRSIFNMVSMTFRTDLSVNQNGFNITASYIAPEDHCYDLEDYGETYRGTVNFTRTMEPCLPWASTTQCRYSALNEKYFNDGLDVNYCRNPGGDGFRPWCYTGYSEKEGCLRNYCDVCLKENIFDTLDNCAELTTNTTFCEEDPQAFRGCAKTCASALPELPTIEKAIDVTCSAPTLPSDGVLASTHHCTYKLGETLEARCVTSNDTVTATCLTDGSWNLGNYVCGVCQSGWAPHNGYCFKYFHEELNYVDATARCEEFGGILAPATTQEEFDYLVSQRIFMRKMWLGADDKATEGTWMWQDGSEVTWTRWQANEPDNRSSEDCAYIDRESRDSTWKDTYCTSYFTNFICRIEVAENTTCVDRQDDCMDIFLTNPKSCQDFPDFARQECPNTCGLCTGSTCSVPTQSANTEVVTPASGGSLSTGEYISFACVDGHVKTGGDLDRGCMTNGQLTGEAPVCTSLNDLVTPNNNVELKSRAYVGSTRYVYTGPMPEFNITKTGEITEWRFYTKYSGSAALQVWRQVATDSYTFIGQNIITTEDDTIQTVTVRQEDRIPVEPGDSIGVYYSSGKGGICYNYDCSSDDGMVIKSAGSISNTGSFVAGTDYSFSASSLRCRVFSLTGMVGPRPA